MKSLKFQASCYVPICSRWTQHCRHVDNTLMATLTSVYTSSCLLVHCPHRMSISYIYLIVHHVTASTRLLSSNSGWMAEVWKFELFFDMRTRLKRMKLPIIQAITQLCSLNSGWMAEIWKFRKSRCQKRKRSAYFGVQLLFIAPKMACKHPCRVLSHDLDLWPCRSQTEYLYYCECYCWDQYTCWTST